VPRKPTTQRKLEPRKAPSQERSRAKVEQILQATHQLLESQGLEKLTTNAIAKQAGMSVGSLYQYFPNKEAILADVFEQQIRQYTDTAAERFEEIDRLSRISLGETLAAIVDMEVDRCLMLYQMDPDFYRAYQHSYDIHRRINELTISLSNPAWEEWFPQFLALHRDKLRGDDIDLLSRIASHTLSGVLVSTVSEEPELLQKEGFKQELFELLRGYLCK